MKLSALQQSYTNRRSNSFRGSPTLEPSIDGGSKSLAAVFWLVLHGLCCLISLVLGFRFSRLIFFLLFSTTTTTSNNNLFSADALTLQTTLSSSSSSSSPPNGAVVVSSSRVVVGRHGILIRPWPHPNPVEVMKAHRIIERVQREQRLQYGIKDPRTVIAITPTYVRTFQTLHLTGLMHSLMNFTFWISSKKSSILCILLSSANITIPSSFSSLTTLKARSRPQLSLGCNSTGPHFNP